MDFKNRHCFTVMLLLFTQRETDAHEAGPIRMWHVKRAGVAVIVVQADRVEKDVVA